MLDNEKTALAGAALSNTQDQHSQKKPDLQAYSEFNPPDVVGFHVDQPLYVNHLPQDNRWPDPLPIHAAELLPVESFNAHDLLPSALADWVKDAAGRMPCPPDFVAAAAIVALGSVIGAQCVIKPKQFDDWVIVPNLWGAIVGLPSAKKSPAMSAAFKPLDNLIALAKEAYEEELKNFSENDLILNARKDALQHQLKVAAKEEQNNANGGE